MSCSEGRYCLITGGTKGIGRAIVKTFAKEKAKVFTCSRHQDGLDDFLKECKDAGYDVEGCVCDVSRLDDLKHLVDKVKEWCNGKLHILVNNAGSNIRLRAIDYGEGDFEKVINTNLKSAYELSRRCHPMLKAAGTSSVVHIGSIAGGERVLESGCVYAMTKASLSILARSLACEWAADGIRVNCIAPGAIETPLTKHLLNSKEFVEKLMMETPMKRYGQVEDISGVVAFFCSEGASFITGQTLYVDGGYSIRGLGY